MGKALVATVQRRDILLDVAGQDERDTIPASRAARVKESDGQPSAEHPRWTSGTHFAQVSSETQRSAPTVTNHPGRSIASLSEEQLPGGLAKHRAVEFTASGTLVIHTWYESGDGSIAQCPVVTLTTDAAESLARFLRSIGL